MTQRINVLLHGFGSAPIVFRHFLDIARQERPDIDWHIILPTSTHHDLIREVIPEENILNIEDRLPNPPQGCDLSELTNYNGSLVEDLEAQKRSWFKRNGDNFYKRGQDYYTLYRQYMIENNINHLLCIAVETPETKIAMAVALELGIDTAYTAGLRTITGTVFSTTPYETLPKYQITSPAHVATAEKFVTEFRKSPLPAFALPFDRNTSATAAEQLYDYKPPLIWRLLQKLQISLRRPDLSEPDMARVSLLNNLQPLRDAYWKFRSYYNNKLANIHHISELPKKFILYPLQVTPESSINVPAPYYVEQLRIIDALRISMPNDYTLVVKEHRVGATTRSTRLTKSIRNLPGVKVASHELPSIELLKKANLLATVTGTMALESFILGRAAIVFGRGFCADMHGGTVGINGLDRIIREKLDTQIPDDLIYQTLAKYFSCRYPFIGASTGMPNEPVLRRGNIRAFFDAYMDHIDRISHLNAT